MFLHTHLSCRFLTFECQVLLEERLHGDTFDDSLLDQIFLLMIQGFLSETGNLNKTLFYVLAVTCSALSH